MMSLATTALTRATMATTSSIFVMQSQMRSSSVGKRGWGRTSHQIFVGSSMHPVLIIVRTKWSYSSAELKRSGMPVLGNSENTTLR